MNFTVEELKYLNYVLSCSTDYTRARSEQLITPSVNHKELQQKIEMYIHRLTS